MTSRDPKPMVLSPSVDSSGDPHWGGIDGRWSLFELRLGTPEQVFRVFPDTFGSQVIVPHEKSCDQAKDYDLCAKHRGLKSGGSNSSAGYEVGLSSTQNELTTQITQFTPEMYKDSAGNNTASYLLDTIRMDAGDDEVATLKDQAFGLVIDNAPYVGVFGLAPNASELLANQDEENEIDFYPSILESLKAQDIIPSLSYRYTAGLANGSSFPASLTLGGYDSARLISNDAIFPFRSGSASNVTIGIQRITTSEAIQPTYTLMDKIESAVIDTSIPHLWLPRHVCDRFEEAFSLNFDPEAEIYFVYGAVHEQLKRLDPEITFSLGLNADDMSDPERTVNITLSYASFDLAWTPPDNSSHGERLYFPVRRALEDRPLRLGRAFLQQSYLVVDYESSSFSVYQARAQTSTPEQDIVTIPATGRQTSPKPLADSEKEQSESAKKLGSGGIAGIVVLCIVGLVILGVAAWFFWRRKKRQAARRVYRNQPKWIGDPESRYVSLNDLSGETDSGWAARTDR